MGRFSLVGLLVLLATYTFGHPHHQQAERRAVDLGAYRLRGGGSYVSVPGSSTKKRNSRLRKRDHTSNVATAVKFLRQNFPNTSFRLIEDFYTGTNGVEHLYFKQIVNNIDIDNSNLNLNFNQDGTILSYGHSIYSGPVPSASTLHKRDFVGPIAALKVVSELLNLPIAVDTATARISGEVKGLEDTPGGASSSEPSALQGNYVIRGSTGAYQDPKAKLVYLQSETGGLDLVWRVETDILDTWLLTYVEAKSAESIMGVVEYVAHSSYQVYPWGQINPTEGPRVVETDSYDPVASPFTWENGNATGILTTFGNNAIAQSNWNANDNIGDDNRPRANNGNFSFNLNLNSANPRDYIEASVTQLFYTSNMIHDLLYTLGFTEEAGNFQELNDGTGGVSGDPVILNSQDGSGTNNANFLTPPDGNSGRMRMYLWGQVNGTRPMRDSSFDSDIVLHEYGHGLSNRLTGGPANSACLTTREANGMGEGWSDFIAIAINLNGNETRALNRPIGAWSAGTARGIRQVLYSTNTSVNNWVYSRVNTETITHNIGTVWNTMLYEIMWNLIDKHGITTSRKPVFQEGTVIPTDGRYLTMKIVIDAMALQPCNPTFVSARQAILDADRVLTNGDNACEIWKGFAKRGLGAAVNGTGGTRIDDFSIPSGVC